MSEPHSAEGEEGQKKGSEKVQKKQVVLLHDGARSTVSSEFIPMNDKRRDDIISELVHLPPSAEHWWTTPSNPDVDLHVFHFAHGTVDPRVKMVKFPDLPFNIRSLMRVKVGREIGGLTKQALRTPHHQSLHDIISKPIFDESPRSSPFVAPPASSFSPSPSLSPSPFGGGEKKPIPPLKQGQSGKIAPKEEGREVLPKPPARKKSIRLSPAKRNALIATAVLAGLGLSGIVIKSAGA